MGNPYHRPNGQFGTNHEREAFTKGLAKGVTRGIAIGVSMAAKAVALPVQLVWSIIRGSRNSSGHG